MNRYTLPQGMRYSTLAERRLFYEKEFDLTSVDRWLKPLAAHHIVFAVIMGRHTRIFRPEYAEDASTTILIENYQNLEDVRREILEFLPEAVYYDRNLYDVTTGKAMGQELAFDLDPENLTCPIHGTLEDKLKRRQGLSFCEIELKMVTEETVKLYERLRQLFCEVRIVYSGRGFHIHVFDKESFIWSRRKRGELARKLKKEGFLIDEWVTTGGMRLIRLPYSLHCMVSRIVLPLGINELPSFNPVTDKRCIPKFLQS
jgi:DNA primase catalytic subunit